MDINFNDPAYGKMFANSKSNKVNNQKNITPEKNEPDVSDIITIRKQKQIKIIAVLLFLFSILLIIALISYTPKDEPNTTISLHEILDVMKGNALARAKFDTTQNWLGLIGAIISNFFYNKTFGISILFLPVFIILYSKELYKQLRISDKLIKNTIIYLLLAILFSGFFGTLQHISLFSFIPKEYSGAVGQFLSSVISNFIGSIGSILLFLTGIVLTVILGTDIKFKELYNNIINKSKEIIFVLYKFFHKIFLSRDEAINQPIISFQNETNNSNNNSNLDNLVNKNNLSSKASNIYKNKEDKDFIKENQSDNISLTNDKKSKLGFFKKKENIIIEPQQPTETKEETVIEEEISSFSTSSISW
jgi:hypothetical protein